MIALFCAGCVRLFGWDIHAPGILSSDFAKQVAPVHERLALYLPKDILTYQSTERGGRLADPQIYHVGEAFGPMIVEAFQNGFDEFVLMETGPSADILKRYAIPHLVTVRIKEFKNRVTLKGQAVTLLTETVVFGSDLNVLARFESRGTSDARKVFAKKGGPEVNLNAAIERNVMAIVQYLQDFVKDQAGAKT